MNIFDIIKSIMNEIDRYNKLNKFFKDKFGERVGKICIDAGFTCPNRDGKVSYGGCIFCSENGSGEHINKIEDISQQVINYINSYKGKRVNKYIAYFQNFTNTYDSIENLKSKYNAALIDDRIIGLFIATRPDCINEDIARLISSYSDKYYVCVELGLQTSNDETAEFINRGYSSNDFSKAVHILNKYNIDILTHIMVGLPNETINDIKNTVNFINTHNISGIKIHSTYVVEKTKLNDLYKLNQYIPISLYEYLENLTFILTHVRPDIIVHRLTGDAPKDILVAPSWNSHKKLVLNGIEKIMKENNLNQGIYYKK